jgi:hypothetical protein
MNRNKFNLLARQFVLCAVFLSTTAVALPQTEPKKKEVPAKIGEQSLPEEWNGVWKGMTVNVTADGKREEIPMELRVAPAAGGNVKTWKILYGKNAEQTTRPYEIMPVSGEPNRFVVDEKNGLFIDNQLVGNKLYSQFMVTTNLVTTRFEIKGDEISVELMMFDLRSPRKTKLTSGNVEVASYKFRSTQLGTLEREKSAK